MNYLEWKQKFDVELNPQQEEAVQSIEGAVLLLAVPGSGKTTVLVSRLSYMIYGREIDPKKILTVTYTVAATNDMKRRFEQRFGRKYTNQLEFKTINGLSYKILQYYGSITGKKLFPLIEKEASTMIKVIYKNCTNQFATENDIKNIQTAITYVKNMGFQKDEIR